MPVDDPSQRTLDEIPARAVTFLRGVGTNRVIAATMRQHGFAAEERQRGWALVHSASGYDLPDDNEYSTDVRAAIVALDANDETMFAVIAAATRYSFPDQYDFLFAGGLAPTTGAGSVLTNQTMLDRLDALESSADRKATRKQDHAALERIATRGITAKERQRLRGLIETATSADDSAQTQQEEADARQHHIESLLALYRWYSEWAEIARVYVKRHDHQIRLGLARRKKPKPADPHTSLSPTPALPKS